MEYKKDNQDLLKIDYKESQTLETLEDHFHNQHQLILVTEGSAEFKIDKKLHLVKENSLVIISNMEQHQIQMVQTPYKRYILSIRNDLCLLEIREPLLLSILLHRPPHFSSVIPISESFMPDILRYFHQLTKEYKEKPPLFTTRCALLLTDMLLLLYRSTPQVFPNFKDSSSIKTVIETQKYIAQNYNTPLSLDSIADKFFISKFYLSKEFKTITGYGFKEYVILYRLNEAKKLLHSTTDSVTDICYAVGYNSVNHFIRIFRLYEGISPLQYRKTMPTHSVFTKNN